MPRIYKSKGDLRRSEHLTALFTKEEKQRIQDFAASRNMHVSVFIHRVVLDQIRTESAA